jgi:4-amino-4-deoxy-L-arabinose transferase-like glycosyltransferase
LIQNIYGISLILLCGALLISTFTHLFNSPGFPCLNPDEGKYVRRALHVLEGLGPQDPSSRFDHGQETNSSYDHPHFGQIFLAGIFQIIGYPSSLHTLPTVESIEMLYTVPRVLMGILAVVDTFLLYKIAERRYNRNVALVSSILFAVMPLSWLNRWILLDNILLPFLLLSILFALYLKRNNDNNNDNDIHDNLDSTKKDTQASISSNSNDFRKITLTMLSGIFLGLAIYTKITAFTMIPLVGFLIFTNNKSFKSLALWLVPVILIPSLWPLYALSVGQFDEWLDGVIWQGLERPSTGVLDQLTTLFSMDPVLVVLSIIGTIYLAVRRDYLVLLWSAPFLIFAISIHWIYPFHFILLLPAACIASALLIEVPKRIIKKENYQKLISITIISGIGLFGLVSISTVLNTNFLLTQILHVSLAINSLQGAENNKDTTIISAPEYSWIFKYIFNDKYVYQTRESSIKTDKILLMVDRAYFSVVSGDLLKPEIENKQQIKLLMDIYNNTNPKISIMDDDVPSNLQRYPYTNIKNCSFKNLQIRTNY